MIDHPFVILGVLTFSAFLLSMVVLRIGRAPSPYRYLARWHFLFAGVYLVACLAWIKLHPGDPFSWEDGFLGLYIYFALQYAFFAHIFATIFRGFSIGICLAVFQNGGRALLSSIQTSYDDGKGIDYVKNERITVLLESGALVEKNGKLTLTPFGRFVANLNRWILKIWNLGYLGIRESDTKS